MDEVSESLGRFYDSIWRDTPGYVYLASMEGGTDFKQYLIEWPKQRAAVVRHTLAQSAAGRDIYYSPSLYKERTRPTKENAKGSWVLWVDFDSNAPQDWTQVAKENEVPEPSIVVQSSVEANQHAYWQLSSFATSIEEIEDRNRSLAYRLKADTSGWDVDQLLRPPYTYNYGYKTPDQHKSWYVDAPAPVSVLQSTEALSGIEDFSVLSTPEKEYLHQIKIENLPPIADVLALARWSEEFYTAFTMTKEEASASSPEKRSGALMRLGYLGVENGLSDEQLYSVLDDADKRWEKYTKRSRAGRHKLLLDIIARARAKKGYLTEETLTFAGLLQDASLVQESKIVYNFTEFLSHEVYLEWLVEDFITQGGFAVVTGQPGVGKTQWGVQFLISMALGLDTFLKWPIAVGPKKALFLSLEMGHAPLKYFMQKMAGNYKDHRLLERNLHIAPLGEPLPLQTKQGQTFLTNLISEYKPDVLLIDSLQAISGKSLSDEESVKNLVHYLKRMRAQTNCTILLIHHNRKKQPESRSAGDLSDMFGSQFLAAEIDTCANLRALGGTRILSVDCWKNRLAQMWPTFEIERNDNLQYHMYTGQGGGFYVGPDDDSEGTGLAL